MKKLRTPPPFFFTKIPKQGRREKEGETREKEKREEKGKKARKKKREKGKRKGVKKRGNYSILFPCLS